MGTSGSGGDRTHALSSTRARTQVPTLNARETKRARSAPGAPDPWVASVVAADREVGRHVTPPASWLRPRWRSPVGARYEPARPRGSQDAQVAPAGGVPESYSAANVSFHKITNTAPQ